MTAAFIAISRNRRPGPCNRPVGLAMTIVATIAVLLSHPAVAEPYFAIMTGDKCAACHVNETGGGKRTAYGNAFGQVTLPARTPKEGFWNGEVMKYLALGGDLRANASYTDIPNQGNEFEFDVEEARLYLEVSLLEDRLTLYLDQQVSPTSENREAFALLHFWDGKAYIKGGQFYLPYGLRLEDDTEFIRQAVGINMNTPDDGIEFGLDLNDLSMQLAITNGSAGGAENDTGKQYSFLAAYVRNRWRVGTSINFNDSGDEDRTVLGGFGGLRTGPVSWLGELDYIDDDGLGANGRNQWVGFVEGNWLITRGHNLKLTYGGFDPDDDVSNDDQNRYSLVYEYMPFSYTQIRAGARIRDGIPQNDAQNTDFYFLELHVYF